MRLTSSLAGQHSKSEILHRVYPKLIARISSPIVEQCRTRADDYQEPTSPEKSSTTRCSSRERLPTTLARQRKIRLYLANRFSWSQATSLTALKCASVEESKRSEESGYIMLVGSKHVGRLPERMCYPKECNLCSTIPCADGRLG
jgi:hypothetical protein